MLKLQMRSRYNFTLNYSSYTPQQHLKSMLKKINQSIYKYKHTNKIIYKKNILVILKHKLVYWSKKFNNIIA